MTRLEHLIIEHTSTHPGMEIHDLYKLLHQGIFGPGHLIGPGSEFLLAIESEMRGLGPPRSGEKRIESIHPEDLAFRVNLRPFRAESRPVDRLAEAVRRSIPLFAGRRGDFLDLWEEARTLGEAGRIPFSRGSFEGLERQIDWTTLPPLHHSERYRSQSRPSYRVVHRLVLDDLGFTES
jgi:hypothetical protein